MSSGQATCSNSLSVSRSRHELELTVPTQSNQMSLWRKMPLELRAGMNGVPMTWSSKE